MTKVLQTLRLFSACLGCVPSLAYALLYLLCIPVFACFYDSLPDDFIHTNVKHEKTIQDDANAILIDIQRSVIAKAKHVHGKDHIESGKWVLHLDQIELESLSYENDAFVLSMKVQMTAVDGKGRIKSNAVRVSMAAYPASISQVGDTERWTFYHQMRVSGPDLLDFDFEQVFAMSTDRRIRHKIIELDEEVEDRIAAYIRAMNGFPGSSSGNYGRMLYFSAVTITTVGYGDIVPISPKARTLVTVEAILGVVLIGLFLNALAQEISKKTKHQEEGAERT